MVGYVSTQGDMVKKKDNQAVRISTALPPTNFAINSPMDRPRPGGGLNASFAPTTVDFWRSVGVST